VVLQGPYRRDPGRRRGGGERSAYAAFPGGIDWVILWQSCRSDVGGVMSLRFGKVKAESVEMAGTRTRNFNH
jgi:hypothetical protein